MTFLGRRRVCDENLRKSQHSTLARAHSVPECKAPLLTWPRAAAAARRRGVFAAFSCVRRILHARSHCPRRPHRATATPAAAAQPLAPSAPMHRPLLLPKSRAALPSPTLFAHCWRTIARAGAAPSTPSCWRPRPPPPFCRRCEMRAYVRLLR